MEYLQQAANAHFSFPYSSAGGRRRGGGFHFQPRPSYGGWGLAKGNAHYLSPAYNWQLEMMRRHLKATLARQQLVDNFEFLRRCGAAGDVRREMDNDYLDYIRRDADEEFRRNGVDSDLVANGNASAFRQVSSPDGRGSLPLPRPPAYDSDGDSARADSGEQQSALSFSIKTNVFHGSRYRQQRAHEGVGKIKGRGQFLLSLNGKRSRRDPVSTCVQCAKPLTSYRKREFDSCFCNSRPGDQRHAPVCGRCGSCRKNAGGHLLELQSTRRGERKSNFVIASARWL